MADVMAKRKFPDVVGVGGAWNIKNPAWQIPYGTLLPKTVDNLLVAGRCVSAEAKIDRVDAGKSRPASSPVTRRGVAAAVAVARQVPAPARSTSEKSARYSPSRARIWG